MSRFIKTKIICTLGPALDDDDTLRRMIASGMDAARMNFSHGSHEEHGSRLARLRRLCDMMQVHIPVLLDTKGPEIRLGVFPDGEAELREDQDYTLTTEDVPCTAQIASVSHAGLPGDVQPGDSILIDDGLVELEVRSVKAPEIHCRVLNSGRVSSRKSLNVPGAKLSLPALTDRDRADILFAVENDYDFIALSFARKKEDVLEVRRFLQENGGEGINIIAKIENREGLDNLEEIIVVSDGIMVARGDLGVEIPVEEIPVVQKRMIRSTYRSGKPVITATQMLDSMIRNPRPTRAEVTDVANAIFDGTSAIMLSGETASGKYPVEALQTMKRVAGTAERAIHYWKRFRSQEEWDTASITNAISHATCTTAMDLNASAIVAITSSGRTARKISGFRPESPIIGTTPNLRVMRQLRLSWGIIPMLVQPGKSTDDLFSLAVTAAKESGLVEDGDLIVVTAGVPVGLSGTTNMLKVQMVGSTLCRGRGIGTGVATGPLCVVGRGAQPPSFARGSILAAEELTDDLLPHVRQAAAVVIEGHENEEQAGILAKTLEIPILVGADSATQLLKSGTVVSVDAQRGVVICAD